MAKKFKFCLHCRRSITESHIARGLFVKTKYGMLCPECAQSLEENEPAPEQAVEATPVAPSAPPPAPEPVPQPEPKPEPAPAEVAPPVAPEAPTAAPGGAPPGPAPLLGHDALRFLTRLHEEVETIRRTLLFEKTSPWNVIGVVSQCVALCIFGIAVVQWSDRPTNLLLLAIFLQLMTVTAFLKAK